MAQAGRSWCRRRRRRQSRATSAGSDRRVGSNGLPRFRGRSCVSYGCDAVAWGRGARVCAFERGARAAGSRRTRAPGGGVRVHVRACLGSLPSVDRRAGSELVRVVGARWHRDADRAAADRDRGDVPDDPDASGDRRAGGRDERGDAAGTVLPRCRYRGEPQRACARRQVAADLRASRDAPRGGGGDARAVAGRADEPPGTALHGRERPALHAAQGATGDHGRRERAEGGRARR